MNSNHEKLMPSPEWAAYMHQEVLPVATQDVDLGGEALERDQGQAR
jgi:hypothetical protein